MSTIKERIQKEITDHKVVLYMKGTAEAPQCGFSAAVVQCLNTVGAKFHVINVFDDAEIREGIKQFSNWPTIPQLYINGQFVGGCDITKELYQSGELKKLVSQT